MTTLTLKPFVFALAVFVSCGNLAFADRPLTSEERMQNAQQDKVYHESLKERLHHLPPILQAFFESERRDGLKYERDDELMVLEICDLLERNEGKNLKECTSYLKNQGKSWNKTCSDPNAIVGILSKEPTDSRNKPVDCHNKDLSVVKRALSERKSNEHVRVVTGRDENSAEYVGMPSK